MNRIAQTMLVIISFVLMTVGLLDLVSQYKEGGEMSLTFPLVLIGFGFGLPVFVFIPDLIEHKDDDQLEQYSDTSNGVAGDSGESGDD